MFRFCSFLRNACTRSSSINLGHYRVVQSPNFPGERRLANHNFLLLAASHQFLNQRRFLSEQGEKGDFLGKKELIEMGHFCPGVLSVDLPPEGKTFLTIGDFEAFYYIASMKKNTKHKIFGWVRDYNFFVVEQCPKEYLLKRPVIPLKWKAPLIGEFKLNFDASFWKVFNKGVYKGIGGWGSVLRDSENKVIKIFSGFIEEASSATQCELISVYKSLYQAMVFFKENYGYIPKIILEGDCKFAIDAIHGFVSVEKEYADIICLILELLNEIPDFELLWNFRELNQVADYIAVQARKRLPIEYERIVELANLDKVETKLVVDTMEESHNEEN